ncbi:MAG TPA: MFS transporter [Acidimicrobiales bacterium]|nr:MFS transporter [Acidimicrobiales bacterium]
MDAPALDHDATGMAKWLPMPFVALGVSMIIVDATIVNVAVPTIIREFHVSANTSEWFNSIYSLVFASLLITLGHTGDVWGRRKLFASGVVVFVAASLVAATAPTSGVLILGRFLQGIGGAMILPTTLSTVNAIYQGRDRAVAFAIWGSTIGGMAAVGPLLGGWLTTDFSWRWAFLINVPVGVVVLVGILLAVPETKDPHVRRGIDWTGNLLVIVGFASLVFGLIEGEHYGWWSQTESLSLGSSTWPSGWPSPVPVAFAIAIVALSSFVLVEAHRATRSKVVLVNLELFKIRSFAAGNVAVTVVAFGEFGLLFVLPLFLQGVLGFSALDTGWLFLSLAIGSFVVGGATPQLAKRISPRGVARTGLVFEIIGIAGLGATLSATVSVWVMAAWLFVYGMGVGMATAQLTGVILVDVPVEESGQASGIQSTSRQVGSALGVAVLGAILLSTLASKTTSALRAVPGFSQAVSDQVVHIVRASGGAAIGSLGSLPDGTAVVAAASGAAVDAARAVAFAAAGFILLGLIATLLLPPTGKDPSDSSPSAGAPAATGED